MRVAHAPGMPGTFSLVDDSKGNRYLAIPACIAARAARTCRDACRDRLPPVAGKMLPAFPAHAHPHFSVSGKRPMEWRELCFGSWFFDRGPHLDISLRQTLSQRWLDYLIDSEFIPQSRINSSTRPLHTVSNLSARRFLVQLNMIALQQKNWTSVLISLVGESVLKPFDLANPRFKVQRLSMKSPYFQARNGNYDILIPCFFIKTSDFVQNACGRRFSNWDVESASLWINFV